VFRPYQFQVNPVRSDAAPPAQTVVYGPSRSMVYPVARALDLSVIPAAGTKDFFLWHPYQDSVQDIVIGVDETVTAPPGFTAQLVQVNAEVETVLTEPQAIDQFTVEPVSLPLPGQVLDGPVFLRVVVPATALTIFVTIHAMTSEIR
jgi:hypothetical protein